MKHVGLVGWRGMVGSVLMQRMQEENDFKRFKACFFSSSQAGQPTPEYGNAETHQHCATDLDALMAQDIIISCQGGNYTADMYPKLRQAGWQGYWIDAASTLRLADDATIILDPVNHTQITQALNQGKKTFVGGNCTVSLMLMALGGLFKQGWVQWASVATYQAISGNGMQAMRELLAQMLTLTPALHTLKDASHSDVLTQIAALNTHMQDASFPTQQIQAPLVNNLLPWIDSAMPNGQTREEWKGQVETNRILGTETDPIGIDGTCVRMDALRCHSQAITLKLTGDIPLTDIEQCLAAQHDWLTRIPNTPDATRVGLTPHAFSGRLDIGVGRLRKMTLGNDFLNVFTLGDQLLWGAAEPLRRMLQFL